MKPVLKFAITGKNYRQIEMALNEGYTLTGKSTFPTVCVILKLEPSKKDILRITSFEDATYFMGGGYPRPNMVASDTMVVRLSKEKESAIDSLIEKMQAGWLVQSVTIGKSAVLTKTRDISTLCTDVSQLEEIVYSISKSGRIRK